MKVKNDFKNPRVTAETEKRMSRVNLKYIIMKFELFKSALFFFCVVSLNFAANGQSLGGGGECTASLACSSHPRDYIECSGQECERDPLSRSVTCDGVTSSC